ncbi:RNA polymerase sigma factor [Neptunomonas qingdaonensis]|uniref:RNA polymerase sigma-70 factor, ECF subfamily n=1 Tax=Neptunomonas qingdaonensis TaxID=1045558 RepID=A0A1I2M4Z8_9GAMM|nr:sigma-70 family RNA polymerase sigma factor [Neptunomonas qingdaonensis]SFF85960.1 RNA polymerase sigma-70 factor, ECF subfamily [Neptunomonas qingdaonensis]
MNLSEIQTLTDNELIDLIQQQDRNAPRLFDELIDRYRAVLFHRCLCRLSNVADAEDVVQEALSRSYRYLSAFRGESSFKTWLFTIADNQCNRFFAKRERYQLTDDMTVLIDQEEALYTPPEDSAQNEDVRKILNGLPEYARDILMLRFDLELSLAGISQTLGISLSAAKMRLYRAIELFEKQFVSSVEIIV